VVGAEEGDEGEHDERGHGGADQHAVSGHGRS
jgi:hypothetical protein